MNTITATQRRTKFQSEVRREMQSAQVDYDTAFQTVTSLRGAELLPESKPPGPHAALANDSGVELTRSEQIQKLIRELGAELGMVLPKDYDFLFRRVMQAHPELHGTKPSPIFGARQMNLRSDLTPQRQREGVDTPAGPMGSALHPAVKFNPQIERQFRRTGKKSQG